MQILQDVNLDAEYVRHDTPIFCHNHPTQPDGMNAATKKLLAALKELDIDIEGGSVGDMLKSVYDPGDDGRVQQAESVSDGTLTTAAGDVHDHLFSSGHVHFTEASINHPNLIGAGDYTHADIDNHVGPGLYQHPSIDAHIDDNVAHMPYIITPVPVTGIALPVTIIKYGAVCVGNEDIQATPLKFRMSQDGDQAWRGTWGEPKALYLACFFEAGVVVIQYFNQLGIMQQVQITENTGGDWQGRKIMLEPKMRCNDDFAPGDLKITAASAVPFYLSGLRIKYPGTQISYAEWRAVL